MNINFPTSHHLEHVALLASQLRVPLSSLGPPHSLLCDVDILRHFRNAWICNHFLPAWGMTLRVLKQPQLRISSQISLGRADRSCGLGSWTVAKSGLRVLGKIKRDTDT